MEKKHLIMVLLGIALVIALFWYSYRIGAQLESIANLNITWWYVLFIACGCLSLVGIKYSIHKKINAKCTQYEYWNGDKCVSITQHLEEKTKKEQIVSGLFSSNYL